MVQVLGVTCPRCRRFLGAVLSGVRVRCPDCHTWTKPTGAPQRPTAAPKGGGAA